MRYSIELGPVECRIGSFFEYEISEGNAEKIHASVMGWYRSLSNEEKRFIKSVEAFPAFIRYGGTFPTRYITIRVTCTAGTLEPPERMVVPDGGEKGWELYFDHLCLMEDLDHALKKFSQFANNELVAVLGAFKNVKPRVSVIWREDRSQR